MRGARFVLAAALAAACGGRSELEHIGQYGSAEGSAPPTGPGFCPLTPPHVGDGCAPPDGGTGYCVYRPLTAGADGLQCTCIAAGGSGMWVDCAALPAPAQPGCGTEVCSAAVAGGECIAGQGAACCVCDPAASETFTCGPC